MEEAGDIQTKDRTQKKSILKEMILENFMSYEYGRISFGSGLNVICGPNGAGKSSILLAMSVVLGQSYTERSRKLSDLIRRGKDLARVSLVFENASREGGRRAIPFSHSDTFMLSRYLKRDGSYWYEGDYRELSKAEVTRLLHQFGVSPDNPLIIMHQGMVEEFSVTSPQEKLVMVEESVGFDKYRSNILEAQEKLGGLVGEETSTTKLIENASQTLDYWKGVYDRYLQKRSLLEKKKSLEREMYWSQVSRLEKSLESSRERLEGRKRILESTINKMERTANAANEAWTSLSAERSELRKFYYSLAKLERGFGTSTAHKDSLAEFSSLLLDNLRGLPITSEEKQGPYDLRKHFEAMQSIAHQYSSKADDVNRKAKDLENEIKEVQGEIGKAEDTLTTSINKFVDLKVSEALLNQEKKALEKEILEIQKGMRDTDSVLQELIRKQPEGPKMETGRTQLEVGDDLRTVSVHLVTLQDVPEEAETIYSNYSTIHRELEEKLRLVRENKHLVLQELQERRKLWKETLTSLVDEVNPRYQKILSGVSAAGLIRLINLDDVNDAGLELLVGFRGSSSVLLDAYTQSGGERSVSIMAFLMSLQDRIISPFRAVDEFDVHMDPKNREAMMEMLFGQMGKQGLGQYLVITPSQFTVQDKNVNLIFVQSTQARSRAEVVRNAKPSRS